MSGFLSDDTGLLLDRLRTDLDHLDARLSKNLEKKQDISVAKLEISAMQEKLATVERIAGDAIRTAENHTCHQSGTLEDIRQSIHRLDASVNSWKNMKIGAVVTLLVALVTGAWFVFQMKGDQAVLNVKVTAIEESMDEVNESVREITTDRMQKDELILETLRSVKEDIRVVAGKKGN